MDEKKLRKVIEGMTDGNFIDVLDTLIGFEFGLTATEWIEHQYKTGKKGVRAILDEYEGDDSGIAYTRENVCASGHKQDEDGRCRCTNKNSN